jgi:hypothetical protein
MNNKTIKKKEPFMFKKKYNTEEERIEARREANRRYEKSPKGRARDKKATKKYYNSDKGLATRTAYYNSEKTQKRLKEYRNNPENKKKHNEYQSQFHKTAKGIAIEKKRRKTERYKIRVKTYEEKRIKDPNRIKWRRGYQKRPDVIERRIKHSKTDGHIKNRRAYRARQYKENPQFKLADNVRKRIVRYLKGINGRKFGKTNELLGCDWKFLKKHLTDQFYNQKKTNKEMSWNNYGKWHVDHIIPLSSFDLTIVEKQFTACHFSNLQPLWAKDNLEKNNRLDWKKNN